MKANPLFFPLPISPLRAPLFYRSDNALRFDLQVGETNTDAYFQAVLERATTLLEAVFQPREEILLVLNELAWGKRKIRFGNFVFQQIDGLTRADVRYRNILDLYEPGDRWNQAIVPTTLNRLGYQQILAAISHMDFPSRRPQLGPPGTASAREVYLVSPGRQLVFHMYDDRGLDVAAADIETLRPLYAQFADWLLDYDRELMAERMS